MAEVTKNAESLKRVKVLEEAFQRHPWPQGCKVPTKAAVPTKVVLLQNSLKRVKLLLTS